MAPEQLRGLHGELDERTDVFALGATLYQILTGNTHTGYRLDLHESDLPGGGVPHPPHRHVHEELLFVREGEMEVMISGDLAIMIVEENLTGQPPHDPESWTNIALQKSRVSVQPPERIVDGAIVPAELSRVALKAMSHDPEDRYPSVEEVKREVERFLRGR